MKILNGVEKIVPLIKYLKHPFVLMGFLVFLLFYLFDKILDILNKITPPFSEDSATEVVKLILLYGFIVVIITIVLIFLIVILRSPKISEVFKIINFILIIILTTIKIVPFVPPILNSRVLQKASEPVQEAINHREEDQEPKSATPDDSTITYEVTLILPSDMENATILVDGEPATRLQQLPTIVRILVERKETNHRITVRRDNKECTRERLIRQNMTLNPCY